MAQALVAAVKGLEGEIEASGCNTTRAANATRTAGCAALEGKLVAAVEVLQVATEAAEEVNTKQSSGSEAQGATTVAGDNEVIT